MDDLRAIGSAVAVLVGSFVIWAPLWWIGAGQVPQELVEVMAACGVTLAGGVTSYLRGPKLAVLGRWLCAFAGVALVWLSRLLNRSTLFEGQSRVELTLLGVLTLGAVGMIANAIGGPRPVLEQGS